MEWPAQDPPEPYLEDEMLPGTMKDDDDSSIFVVDSQEMDQQVSYYDDDDHEGHDVDDHSMTNKDFVHMTVKYPLVKIPCPWCPKVLKRYELQVHIVTEHGRGEYSTLWFC